MSACRNLPSLQAFIEKERKKCSSSEVRPPRVIVLWVLFSHDGVVQLCIASIFDALFRKWSRGRKVNLEAACLQSGMTEVMYRKIFTLQERNRMKVKHLYFLYDFHHLYKLSQHVCSLAPREDPVWSAHSTDELCLETILYRLKCIRNSLIDDSSICSRKELLDIIAEVKDLLHRALDIVEQRELCTLNKARDAVKKTLKATLLDHKTVELPLHRQDLQSWRDEMDKGFQPLPVNIANGRKDKKKKKQPINQHFSDDFQGMIPVTLNPRKNIGSSDLRNVIRIYDEVYSEFEDVVTGETAYFDKLLTDKLPDGSTPRVSIITGEQGIGKTCLMIYYYYSWLRKRDDVDDLLSFDMTFLVQHDNTAASSLCKYLQNIMNPFGSMTDQQLLTKFAKERVLFLIDGFDEMVQQASKLLGEILLKLPTCRVIVTTRPHMYRNLRSVTEQALEASPLAAAVRVLRMGYPSKGHWATLAKKNLLTFLDMNDKKRNIKLKAFSRMLEDKVVPMKRPLLPSSLMVLAGAYTQVPVDEEDSEDERVVEPRKRTTSSSSSDSGCDL